MHTCTPPNQARPRTVWQCPECGDLYEAVDLGENIRWDWRGWSGEARE